MCCCKNCRSGYKPKKGEALENVKLPVFGFPDKVELRNLWVRFVNRKDWVPSEHDGICSKHFESKYLLGSWE